jgi:hypothetical protein
MQAGTAITIANVVPFICDIQKPEKEIAYNIFAS